MSFELQSHTTAWQPSQADIDAKPWKYIGYQSFSAFVASDNDLFILRRFGALSARVLLGLQDQLSRLEEDLEALEKKVREKGAPDVDNGSFRYETQKDRQALVCQAQHLLREYSQFSLLRSIVEARHGTAVASTDAGRIYRRCFCYLFLFSSPQADIDYDHPDELVIQHSQIRARPAVPKTDISSLKTWFYNNGSAISAEETDYINHSEDLFSLVPGPPNSPLRSLLECSSRFRMLGLWQQKTNDPVASKDKNVHYFSDDKIDRFIVAFIMSLGLIMLVAPLWILAFLGGLTPRLAVISAFIVLFVALLSVTTVAKPFETLAAAAAYSAVLMVFLQFSNKN